MLPFGDTNVHSVVRCDATEEGIDIHITDEVVYTWGQGPEKRVSHKQNMQGRYQMKPLTHGRYIQIPRHKAGTMADHTGLKIHESGHLNPKVPKNKS